jgi:26S proteasome regulatory subunit (ATPase 3-interacting protein)
LRAQNRPYSAIQLHDNLHGRVNKALMESALAALVEGGAVCKKEYGKAAIFWPAQGAFAAVTQEEVATLNTKVEQLSVAVAAAGAARREAEVRLATLTAGPSGAALEAALGEARAAVAALEARLAAAGSGSGGASSAAPPRVLSAAERAALKQTFARYRACWATRKAAAVDFAGALADGGGPKPAVLFKDAGVETDEEVGVILKDFSAL